MLTFNTENMEPQNFPFKPPVMDYIFKNAEPKHLIKLYQTCKFFYNKFRRNIILNLEMVADGEDELFTPMKTIVRVSNPHLQKIKYFCITDSFVCRVLRFGEVIPLFSDYTVKKLDFCSILLLKEFEILTNAGTIQELKIGRVYGSDNFLSVEDIISQVPNATSIEISESCFNPTTCASLASLNHKAKLSNFVLHNICDFRHFNISFISFILKNAASDCNVRFDFKLYDGDDDSINGINEQIKSIEAKYSDYISRVIKLPDLEKSELLREFML
uniref:F-box domain-containing protein n=1 Tax=Panagrolaimus sp. ES5 TaxID=591445 RepID=A0AC34FAE2_9BILA